MQNETSLRRAAKAGLVAALLASPLALATATPALAALDVSGTWNITFQLDPTLGVGATQCLSFTKTGGVLGLPSSGTWTSPSFSGWGGQYVVSKGNRLRFIGTTGSLLTDEMGTIASTGAAVTGFGFDHFTSSAVHSSGGRFTMVRAACAAKAAPAAHGEDADPAGN